MKKVLSFLILVLSFCDIKSQTFPNIDSVKKYIGDSIVSNRTLKAPSLQKAFNGLAKFTPAIVQDTADVSAPSHGMSRWQRKDSALYFYDTIGSKRWRRGVKKDTTGGGGSSNFQQVTDNGNVTTTPVKFGGKDSCGYRFNPDWSAALAWIKSGTPFIANTSGGKTNFKGGGGSAWTNYLLGNPYYLSSRNWSKEQDFVVGNKSDTSLGFAMGQSGLFGSIYVYAHLADSAGYLSLHSDTTWASMIASTKGVTPFYWSVGDTMTVRLVRRAAYIYGYLLNHTTGQQLSVSYKYKLSYPTTVVSPAQALPKFVFFGGSWDFVNRFRYKTDETKRPDIMFVGNSITNGLNAEEWYQSFPDKSMEGVSGDYSVHGEPGQTLTGFENYLDEFLTYQKPAKMIMCWGANDYFYNHDSFSVRYQRVINRLKDSMVLILKSISPQNAVNVAWLNDTVQALSVRNHLHFINTNPVLRASGGTGINSLYSLDGLHYTSAGHAVEGQMIRDYLIDSGFVSVFHPLTVYPLVFDENPIFNIGLDYQNHPVKVPIDRNLGNANQVSTEARTFTIADNTFTIIGTSLFLTKSGSTVSMSDPGAGTYQFFYPKQSVFRWGTFTGTQNNPDSLGQYSGSGGYNGKVVGMYGFNWGANLIDRGVGNFGGGSATVLTSSANYNLYSGLNGYVVGPGNIIGGNGNKADSYNIIGGLNNEALNGYSLNSGHDNKTNGNTSAGVGHHLTMVGNGTQMYGSYMDDNGGFISMGLSDQENDPLTFGAHKTLYGRFKNGYDLRTTASTTVLSINSSGIVKMPAYGAGTATFDASGNISSVSDVRLKNVKSRYRVGLAGIMKITPISFKWKAESGMETEHIYNGFSAQNIEKALGKDATGINSAGYKSIQDRNIMAALVNAIQEQQAQIEQLKKEIKKLKQR